MTPQTVGSPRARAFMQMPYSFIEARLRARRSDFYEGDRLRSLIELRDVQDLCERIYPNLDIYSHRELEKQLRQDAVGELSALLRMLPPTVGGLFHALLRRFQIDNVAVLLNAWASEGSLDAAEPYMSELPTSLDLPAEQLMEASDVEAFISVLPDRNLQTGMRRAAHIYKDSGRTAFLEMGLHSAFWDGVYESLGELSRSDRAACRAPVDEELHSVGALCVLRAAQTYQMEWDTIAPLVPRLGTRDQLGNLQRLFENPDGQSVLECVPAALRHGLSAEKATNLCELESVFWAGIARIAHNLFYSAYVSPASIVSYYYLRRVELRKLTTVIEMVRQGWDRRDIAERVGLEE